jgi:hypothetical protein
MEANQMISRLQKALNKLSFSNTTFAEDGVPYNDSGVIQRSLTPSAFTQQTTKQVFGIVPVFDESGGVSFYIRFGGPEVISKNTGSVVDNLNVESTYSKFPKSQPFIAKHAVALNQTNYLNYSPSDHAIERRMLQLVLNPATPTVSEFGVFGTARAQALAAYPLRLHFNPDTKSFKLQYAPLGAPDYTDLSDPSVLSVFLIEFITSLLQIEVSKQGATATDTAALLRFVKNRVNVENVIKFVFLQRLSEDFKSAARTHLLTEYDGDGPSNGHDALWVAAFSQMVDNGRAASFQVLAPKAFEVASALMGAIPSASVDGAFPSVNAYLTQLTTADNESSQSLAVEHQAAVNRLNAEHASAIAAVDAVVKTQGDSITKLNEQIEANKRELAAKVEEGKKALAAQAAAAKADQASDRKRERVIGAASAAAVTLWAMQDEELSSLDKLQKGILVGVGALMGAIMPAGFTPVAVLAAPVTATFVAKQLRKHDISADTARLKVSESAETARRKISESAETARRRFSQTQALPEVESAPVVEQAAPAARRPRSRRTEPSA